jgi:hypothetical protein
MAALNDLSGAASAPREPQSLRNVNISESSMLQHGVIDTTAINGYRALSMITLTQPYHGAKTVGGGRHTR